MKQFTLLVCFVLGCINLKAGTITVSSSSFSSFGNVYPFHSSSSFYYTVSGSALTANLIITAPAQFEVSLNYNHGYTQTITLIPVSNTIATTKLYVRYSPNAVGSHSGNVTHVSTGSTTKNTAVSGACIAWAIPVNYYTTVNTQLGAALKTVLYNKILGHTAQGYTPGVWNAFATTDVQASGKLWDIYATRLDTTSPYEYTLVTDQCGTYSVEGDCYNREHSFPQSWFNSGTPMQSDLFHVLASDGKVNGIRSNFPFGAVTNPTTTTLYGGKLGPSATTGYTGTVFEPIDEYKGDFARGYFYMATRYENLIAGWQNNGNANDVLDGTAFPAYDVWQRDLLIAWHNLDPVSDKEIKRNNAIYALQNNRNPYIDSPQFVKKVWGGVIPNQPTINAQNISVTNISNTSVQLNWQSGNGQRRLVIVKANSAVNGLPVDTFQYTANANLNLAQQIGVGNYVVYNGTGSSVTLTNLLQGVTYYYAVIEYNGWYNTTNYATTGYATFNAVTLPVKLVLFNANWVDEHNVALQWQTASEINNCCFEIERSADGVHFETIGKLNGKGNSNVLVRYRYMDNHGQQINQPLYYRLKQIDFDGTETYSDKIFLAPHNNNLEPALKVVPSLFNEFIRIELENEVTGKLEYSLFNAGGTLNINGHENIQINQPIVIHNLSCLQSGFYILQVKLHGRNSYFKLFKP